jgi:hypothetical protein
MTLSFHQAIQERGAGPYNRPVRALHFRHVFHTRANDRPATAGAFFRSTGPFSIR